MNKRIEKSLKELNFKDNEIGVYITLTQLGESTAAKIAKKADLPRTTTIGILDGLKEHGYITTHKYKGATYYWIESPGIIKNNLLNKVKIAEELGDFLRDLYRSEADFPCAHIYDTKSGIKSFIEKTLINIEKKSIIYTIDNPNAGHYNKVLSHEYEAILINLKNKKQITTKTLIPFDTFKTIDPKKIKRQNIIIKEMPQGIYFKASLWIVKDMLVLFSGKYPFIVSVKHKLITESFGSLFDFLWDISTPKNL